MLTKMNDSLSINNRENTRTQKGKFQESTQMHAKMKYKRI